MNQASLLEAGSSVASLKSHSSHLHSSNPGSFRLANEFAGYRVSTVDALDHECANFSESGSSDCARHVSGYRWKRALDVSLVILSLPLTVPLMFAVALWIKLASKGSAIFRQERIGKNGKPFTLYKFRSMHANADTGRHRRHFSHLVRSGSPMVKLDLVCDSHLIPLGCLLRAAGLDELPQLVNILRGDMSLVGPRPCLPEEFRFFSHSQRVRFQALPGLTGVWQSEGKGVSTFAEMNEMDARYVKEASFSLDLAIICRTPIALLRQMRLARQSRRKNESPHFEATKSYR